MIIDTLANAERYFCMHPLFAKAFRYIESVNVNTIEVGQCDIRDESLRGFVTQKPGKTLEEALLGFECHNEFIDIQLCIEGPEMIGWKPRQMCTRQKGWYNPEKDVIFFNETPDMYFKLNKNQFTILFPNDVHAPMIGEGDIKKMVIKVKNIL